MPARCIRPALIVLLTAFAMLPLSPPQPAHAADITVFAAASLKNAMDEVARAWQSETGHTATISYAGSSALARQIEAGAPADLFVSANVSWMDTLQKDGLIRAETRRDLLGNALVLIGFGREMPPVDIEPGIDLVGMLDGERLAMALVDSVPAGIYGKAALQGLGIWDEVEPYVAQADNVRAALRLVATGECPLGIVYRTDAAADDTVAIVGRFPGTTHPPIVYPAAVTAESHSPLAGQFLDYLGSKTARASFERWGFTVLK